MNYHIYLNILKLWLITIKIVVYYVQYIVNELCECDTFS